MRLEFLPGPSHRLGNYIAPLSKFLENLVGPAVRMDSASNFLVYQAALEPLARVEIHHRFHLHPEVLGVLEDMDYLQNFITMNLYRLNLNGFTIVA